jgi:hypothetical protein
VFKVVRSFDRSIVLSEVDSSSLPRVNAGTQVTIGVIFRVKPT